MVKCDICTSTNTHLVTRNITGWPYAWECKDCGAAVGCHADTYEPLGPLASGKTRRLRRLAHHHFDRIWMAGFMSRERAKRWAADAIGISKEFHISQCDSEQLQQVIAISKAYLAKHSKGQNIAELKAKNAQRLNRVARRTAKLNGVERERRRKRR